MIYGNVNELAEFDFLSDKIKECFAYADEHDLSLFEDGTYHIDGENLYVNVVEYETTLAENRFWEAHKKYLDVHLMLRGEEQIDVAILEDMKIGDYLDKDDFLQMEGKSSGSVKLSEGDFLICYPCDAHRTAVAVDSTEKIKKAIFKVII